MCVHVYVCACVHVYACAYVYTRMFAHVCTHVCLRECVHVYVCACVYTCRWHPDILTRYAPQHITTFTFQIYFYVCLCLYVCMPAYMRVSTHVYRYTLRPGAVVTGTVNYLLWVQELVRSSAGAATALNH